MSSPARVHAQNVRVNAGWSNNKASTVGESYARGLSDVIRSRADARYSDALTATELQNTQAQYYKNRVLAAQTFLDVRRMRDDYRDERYAANRAKLTSYLETKKLQPLTQSDLHESTGKITWPPLLRLPEMDKVRTYIDQLFAKRAEDGALTSTDYLQGRESLKKWRQGLAVFKDKVPNSELQDAARFLNQLDAELKSDFH
jgi:hypothetical protein